MNSDRFFLALIHFLFLFFPNISIADSYPPVKAWVMDSQVVHSPEEFCNLYRSSRGFSPHESCPDEYKPWGQNTACKYKVGSNPCNSILYAGTYVCPYGGWFNNDSGLCINAPSCPDGFSRNSLGACVSIPAPCPSGTEKVDEQCLPLCPVGFDRNANGQCVKDCTSKQGQATLNGSYQFYGAVSTWSVSGCRVRCRSRSLAAGGGRGHECYYTGVSADPDDNYAEPVDKLDPDLEPPPEEPDDCLRRGKGYISGPNGVTCVFGPDAPPGQRPNIESDSEQESGTAGPDGKPDPNAGDYKKTETTTKKNGDGTITESKTETTNGKPDGNGGYTCPEGFTKTSDGKCQRQSGSTQDEASYCQKNPSAPQCKGQNDDCKEGSDLVKCVRLGSVKDDGESLLTKRIGVSYISPAAIATGGGCPAGITFPKNLGSYNWEPICDFASALRPIILVLAWISAFFIVFAIKSDG